MRDGPSLELYLNDLIDAIDRIISYTQDLSWEEFQANRITQDAVIRNFEIIGEAVKNIPEDVRELVPDIPWKSHAGMRDKLIHQYFNVSASILWETIQVDLIPLKNAAEFLLNNLGIVENEDA